MTKFISEENFYIVIGNLGKSAKKIGNLGFWKIWMDIHCATHLCNPNPVWKEEKLGNKPTRKRTIKSGASLYFYANSLVGTQFDPQSQRLTISFVSILNIFRK